MTPVVFVSSTCYDLKDARAALASHLVSLGLMPAMSDTPTFGVTPGKHSHVSCLDAVDNAHYLILIIGGRRGGTFVGSEKSITNEEYRRALKRKIPVIIFVKRDVVEAERAFKANPSGDFSHVVDDNRIFDFVATVRAQDEDNWIKEFDTVEDIKRAVTAQFAYIALLFSKQLVEARTPKTKGARRSTDVVPLPGEFTRIIDEEDAMSAPDTITGLKNVHGIIRAIQSSGATGKEEKLKVLWLLGRYGGSDSFGRNDRLIMAEPRFKQYAWGTHRGNRVFAQLADFGVNGEYRDDEDANGVPMTSVVLQFEKAPEASAYALSRYVKDLISEAVDEDSALERFVVGDMNLYRSPSPKKSTGKKAAKQRGKSAGR